MVTGVSEAPYLIAFVARFPERAADVTRVPNGVDRSVAVDVDHEPRANRGLLLFDDVTNDRRGLTSMNLQVLRFARLNPIGIEQIADHLVGADKTLFDLGDEMPGLAEIAGMVKKDIHAHLRNGEWVAKIMREDGDEALAKRPLFLERRYFLVQIGQKVRAVEMKGERIAEKLEARGLTRREGSRLGNSRVDHAANPMPRRQSQSEQRMNAGIAERVGLRGAAQRPPPPETVRRRSIRAAR